MPIQASTALAALLVSSFGCAASSGGGQSEPPAATAFDRDAKSVTSAGVTVERPEGWYFAVSDASVAGDTVVVLHGPSPEEGGMAPVVEISRRKLDTADQSRARGHILTNQMTEIVQLFEGFEGISAAEDVEVAGHPASRITVKFTEVTVDGHEMHRFGAFYGIVREGTLWVIRCIRHPDGSDGDFEGILASLSFAG